MKVTARPAGINQSVSRCTWQVMEAPPPAFRAEILGLFPARPGAESVVHSDEIRAAKDGVANP